MGGLPHVQPTLKSEQADQPVSDSWPIGRRVAIGREIRPRNLRSHKVVLGQLSFDSAVSRGRPVDLRGLGWMSTILLALTPFGIVHICQWLGRARRKTVKRHPRCQWSYLGFPCDRAP
jgi:hypothetical protein